MNFPQATVFEMDVINGVNRIKNQKGLSVFYIGKSIGYTNIKHLKAVLSFEKKCNIETLQKLIDFINSEKK